MKERGNNTLRFIVDHNEAQSREYCSVDAIEGRELLLSILKTTFLWIKCMDGRVNGPLLTGIQAGIFVPFRNMGGIFNTGWPYFQSALDQAIAASKMKGMRSVIFVTYHWSESDEHKGCRAFKYKVEKARAYAESLVHDLENIYGEAHEVVYPIMLGVETDTDSLVIHGRDGDSLSMWEFRHSNEQKVISRLTKMFPDMHHEVMTDLLRLLTGNQSHIKEVQESKRPVAQAHHRERVIAIGSGFDWLHLNNFALIIGPYDPELHIPIANAVEIIRNNFKEDPDLAKEGAVLMISAPYDKDGPNKQFAIKKAEHLAKLAKQVVTEAAKDDKSFLNNMSYLTGIVDSRTRKFYQLEDAAQN